ncbi:Endopolygalacturonase B [Neolecta irregularis DAH-3]|uniref:endo-polygalacturonase n=1 Tax=Neolecta irregularis (strain DAH-3) TaxID=1198029 RepID=A0A1U7LGH1_NEOID|nr:Endopolygalacturonase B [Neolecta irregularis DAH-3]|eukprot:OLL21747.1 Endopolygalacturonase B [Neolecta irregularis DAH-3]
MNFCFAVLQLAFAVSARFRSNHKAIKTLNLEPFADLTSACSVTTWVDLDACLKTTNIIINNLAVPAGKTLDLTSLRPGTHIAFEGSTTFGSASWAGPLISIAGYNIQVTGTGILDGEGAQLWDGKGSNGGKQKPGFFQTINLRYSSINGITVRNSPAQVFQIYQSDHVTISGVTIDNRAGSLLARNTDGFITGSSQHVTISHCVIFNQDDCVAIVSGSDILITNLYCDGGHGLSIGSIGGKRNNVVRNVRFEHSTVINSQNAARIKTNYGTIGSVTNATWTDIILSNISNYGIDIQQNYLNDGSKRKPTNGVNITDITMHNITGTVQNKAIPVYILCGTGSCSNFKFDQINIRGGSHSSCNIPVPGSGC